jgi:signal transduction histidine kinase/ligand-binding sensor domain-containing protein
MRLLTILLASAGTICGAQAQDDLRFTKVLASNGAPATTITTIAKDSLGFYWFGTMDGLLRYDGTSFTTYGSSHSDSSSVPGGTVCSILPNLDGTLWVGTDAGLCRFDPRTGKAHRYHHRPGDPRSIPQDDRTVIVRDDTGNLYVAGAGGLARFDMGLKTFTPLLRADQLDGRISQVLIAHDGSFWLATTHGVKRFDRRTKQVQDIGAPLADPRTRDAQWLAQDATGRIWCAFWGGGLARWDPGSHRFVTYLPRPIPENPSLANIFGQIIPVNEDGRTMILAVGEYGLLRAGAGSGDSALARPHWMVPHDGPVGNGSPSMRCMLREPNGQLWVGGPNGLFVAIPDQQLFQRQAKVSAGDIIRLRQQDSTLFATAWYGQGLTSVDGSGKVTDWILPKQFPDRGQAAQMGDALRLSDGTILVASLAGLLDLDPVSGSYRPISGESEDTPVDVRTTALCDAGDGTVWVGGYGPWLHRYDPRTGHWVHFGAKAGIGPHVNSIVRDTQGHLWTGDMQGLSTYDSATGHFDRVGIIHPNGTAISIPEVNALALGNKGSLWIATMDGLFRRDSTGAFTLFGPKRGLPCHEIDFLAMDPDGNLWASTTAGLTAIGPNGSVRNFTLHSSMPPVSIGGLAMRPDGTMALALGQDLYRFDPRALLRETGPVPSPVITAFSINGTAVGVPTRPLHLHYDQDQLSFTFVAPHFPDQGTVYRYMLTGADHGWNSATADRTVNYANLSPGSYSFLVRTGNGPGLRSTALLFTITPPYWRTGWFMALCGVLVFVIIVAVVRREAQRKLRERILVLEKERAVEAERQRIARDMHDDLGSGLTRIAILGEVAKRQSVVDPDVLNDVSTSARELVENLGNIIWVLNPGHERLPSLLAYIREYAGKTLELSGIALHMETPGPVPDRHLAETVRRNVFLIMKEALNNLIKHAEARNVHIGTVLVGDRLRITITDDGRGFAQEREFGNGLRNMRQRAADIGGELTVQGTEGQGTRVKLTIPLS